MSNCKLILVRCTYIDITIQCNYVILMHFEMYLYINNTKHLDEIHSSTHSLSSCLSYNVMLFIEV